MDCSGRHTITQPQHACVQHVWLSKPLPVLCRAVPCCVQVPRKLAAICAQLKLSANPRAAYAVAQSWRMLCVLLDTAIHDKVLGDHTNLALAAADKQPSLASSMAQQVQQAGLFDQCPKTLRTATQILREATNAAREVVASRGSSSSSSAAEPVLISTFEFINACTMLLSTGYQLTVLLAPSSPILDATIDAIAGKVLRRACWCAFPMLSFAALH